MAPSGRAQATPGAQTLRDDPGVRLTFTDRAFGNVSVAVGNGDPTAARARLLERGKQLSVLELVLADQDDVRVVVASRPPILEVRLTEPIVPDSEVEDLGSSEGGEHRRPGLGVRDIVPVREGVSEGCDPQETGRPLLGVLLQTPHAGGIVGREMGIGDVLSRRRNRVPAEDRVVPGASAVHAQLVEGIPQCRPHRGTDPLHGHADHPFDLPRAQFVEDAGVRIALQHPRVVLGREACLVAEGQHVQREFLDG